MAQANSSVCNPGYVPACLPSQENLEAGHPGGEMTSHDSCKGSLVQDPSQTANVFDSLHPKERSQRIDTAVFSDQKVKDFIGSRISTSTHSNTSFNHAEGYRPHMSANLQASQGAHTGYAVHSKPSHSIEQLESCSIPLRLTGQMNPDEAMSRIISRPILPFAEQQEVVPRDFFALSSAQNSEIQDISNDLGHHRNEERNFLSQMSADSSYSVGRHQLFQNEGITGQFGVDKSFDNSQRFTNLTLGPLTGDSAIHDRFEQYETMKSLADKSHRLTALSLGLQNDDISDAGHKSQRFPSLLLAAGFNENESSSGAGEEQPAGSRSERFPFLSLGSNHEAGPEKISPPRQDIMSFKDATNRRFPNLNFSPDRADKAVYGHQPIIAAPESTPHRFAKLSGHLDDRQTFEREQETSQRFANLTVMPPRTDNAEKIPYASTQMAPHLGAENGHRFSSLGLSPVGMKPTERQAFPSPHIMRYENGRPVNLSLATATHEIAEKRAYETGQMMASPEGQFMHMQGMAAGADRLQPYMNSVADFMMSRNLAYSRKRAKKAAQIEDKEGWRWRKQGQKMIKDGTKRSYYRCAKVDDLGCQASLIVDREEGSVDVALNWECRGEHNHEPEMNYNPASRGPYVYGRRPNQGI